MIAYPEIDPVLVGIGPLQVRWYGLMYVLGFAAVYLLVRRQIREFSQEGLARRFDDLNTALILGVILGGRLGYVFFYHPATADLYVATIPIGLGLGRIGNFINGELFGRVSEVPWAMVFPQGGPWPRHPSQLYEAALEGVLLFLVLWGNRHRPWRQGGKLWPHGSLLALFLALYALLRFAVEFTREPDPHLGLLTGGLSLGQWLSLAMLAGGLALWGWRGTRHARPKNQCAE